MISAIYIYISHLSCKLHNLLPIAFLVLEQRLEKNSLSPQVGKFVHALRQQFRLQIKSIDHLSAIASISERLKVGIAALEVVFDDAGPALESSNRSATGGTRIQYVCCLESISKGKTHSIPWTKIRRNSSVVHNQ